MLVAAVVGLACERRGPKPTAGIHTPQTTSRIIALAPSTVEIVCELGAAERLIAVGSYCDYPPAIARLPRIGGIRDPDLEAILALRPGLLMLRGRSDILNKLCHDNGIAIYHDPTETLAGLERAVLEIGELLHLPQRAAQIVARMQAELAAVRRAVEHRPRPRVLFTTRSPDRLVNIYTASKGSYLDELITLAGGENIFGDQDTDYPLVSMESIVARQPEVIIESLFGAADKPGLHEAIVAQWRRVGPVPAVESGRIHILTADYATVPSPRVGLMAKDLARIIHPEVFVDHE
ncbi:MAG: ABC transporter substrate-binding protein [Phycisphaerae bacterium]|nr:ABC transporter substrate-binding protein [Phycisphaerae bacterium]